MNVSETLVHTAPNPWEPMPSSLRGHMLTSPLPFIMALSAACFGHEDCPTPSEWAKFVVSSALISACGGSLPQPRSLAQPNDIARDLWQATWEALATSSPFKPETKQMLLQVLFPKAERSQMDHPEFVSLFESMWRLASPTLTTLHSVSRLREDVVRNAAAACRNSLLHFAPDLELIGTHADGPREKVLAYMRTRYQW